MTNIIGEIAEYAIQVDQIVRKLAEERDRYQTMVSGLEHEVRSLERRIADGTAENERLKQMLQEARQEVFQLNSVRNSDNHREEDNAV